MGKEDHRQSGTGDLRQGERPPHRIHIACQAQQIRRRHQHHKLPAQGGNGGINAVAQSLKTGTQGNTYRSNGEMDTNDPQCADTEFHKVSRTGILRRTENAHQYIGEQLEHRKSQQHDCHCRTQAKFQSLLDPLGQ